MKTFLPLPCFYVLLLLCLTTGCATKKGQTLLSPKEGQLFLSSGASTEIDDFLEKGKRADYILIGETHTSDKHHLIQAQLLEALGRAGVNPALGLEMLPATKQQTLDAFNRGLLTANQLEHAIGWKQAWGYPYAGYLPIFAVAEKHGIPIYGLNISYEALAHIKEKGLNNAKASARQELPATISMPPQEQRAKLTAFFEAHASQMLKQMPVSKTKGNTLSKKARLDRFLLVQSLWDSTMAHNAIKAHFATGKPVVILAGSQHVESGYGIAHRILLAQPESQILLVLPTSTPPTTTTHTGLADLFFYSPERTSMLGITFIQKGPNLTVESIKPGSRADQAGIKAGDSIRQFNSQPVSTPSHMHMIAVMSKNRSAPDTLTILRKGAKKEFSLPK